YQQCIDPDCNARFPVGQVHVSCPVCARAGRTSLLDVRYHWDQAQPPKSLSFFDGRGQGQGQGASGFDFSGVWRFRELLPFYGSDADIVTIGEGRTNLQDARLLAEHVGAKAGNLFLQYEGLNPSGSFKDNGMTAAFTH